MSNWKCALVCPAALAQWRIELDVAVLRQQLRVRSPCACVRSSSAACGAVCSDGTSCLASASSPGALADLKGSCQAPVEAQAMCQPSASPCPAPVLEYRPVEPVGGAVQQHTCSLELHALAYVPSTQPQSSLGQAALRPALLAQLRALQAAAQAAGKVQRGQAQHFLPPGRNHHIVLCYPVVKADPEMNEAALAPLRKELHAALGLPLDRPALKATNALLWQQLGTGNTDSGAGASERLQDVHQELALPGPRESVHLVQGSYDYHHYMQDRFDDSGWGCAYRSLQTICSWFRLQVRCPASSQLGCVRGIFESLVGRRIKLHLAPTAVSALRVPHPAGLHLKAVAWTS